MKTIYKILRIKDVIKEVEGDEKFIIRSPEDVEKIGGGSGCKICLNTHVSYSSLDYTLNRGYYFRDISMFISVEATFVSALDSAVF